MEISFIRKFILSELPDLAISTSVVDSRYYLYCKDGSVIRVQSRNGGYEIEKKTNVDGIKNESKRISITEDEYLELSKFSNYKIVRQTVVYKNLPNYKIRVYEDRFKGLIRAEVFFRSIADLQNYAPLSWLGKEISKSPLAKDESLLNLGKSKFNEILGSYLKDD